MGQRTVSAKKIGHGTVAGVKRRAVRMTLTRNSARERIKNRQYRALHRSAAELHEDWVKGNIEKSVLKKMAPLAAVVAPVVARVAGALGVGAAEGAAAGGTMASVGRIASKIAPFAGTGGGEKKEPKAPEGQDVPSIKGTITDMPKLIKEDPPLRRAQEDIVRANVERSIISKTFVSEAQRKFFYANAAHHAKGITRKMVNEFESKTPKGKKLPEHVGKKK